MNTLNNNLIGKRFSKLIVIERTNNTNISKSRPSGRVAYICKCDCGNEIIVNDKNLASGNTWCCGCENNHIKYLPKIASAKMVWEISYNEGLSFDDFLKMSQENCFYCNSQPSNKINKFIIGKRKASKYSIDNGDFVYNGLDRIDQTKPHTKNNCVTCCWPCNDRKGTMSKDEFIIWLTNIYNHIGKFEYKEIDVKSMLNEKSIFKQAKYHPRITSARSIWRGHYNKELSFDDFLYLSQQNCFYCDIGPKQIRNHFKYCTVEVSDYAIKNGDFIYNGLDRIDNNLEHIKENCVPCCWPCNDIKGNLSKEDFLNWIKTIYNNLNKKS